MSNTQRKPAQLSDYADKIKVSATVNGGPRIRARAIRAIADMLLAEGFANYSIGWDPETCNVSAHASYPGPGAYHLGRAHELADQDPAKLAERLEDLTTI